MHFYLFHRKLKPYFSKKNYLIFPLEFSFYHIEQQRNEFYEKSEQFSSHNSHRTNTPSKDTTWFARDTSTEGLEGAMAHPKISKPPCTFLLFYVYFIYAFLKHFYILVALKPKVFGSGPRSASCNCFLFMPDEMSYYYPCLMFYNLKLKL